MSTLFTRLLGPMAVMVTLSIAAHAELSPADKQTLVTRFRPYIKTTLDGPTGEQYRPASWQWFISRSTFVSGYEPAYCANAPSGPLHQLGTEDPWPHGDLVLRELDHVPFTSAMLAGDPTIILKQPFSALRVGVAPIDRKYALRINEGDRGGESWDDVVTLGDGMYAHIEEIPDTGGMGSNLVNIEYIFFWAYNEANCSHHNGDINSITIVYDAAADLITRVTYSPHGYALESFRLVRPDTFALVDLVGRKDDLTPQSLRAVQIAVSSVNQYQQGGTAHSPGDSYVQLARDPDTGLYEHPVGYAEHGSHELWPNTTGKLFGSPAHDGNGFAFLPMKINILDRADPVTPDAPFLFFNGKFGTDPNSVMMHNGWFWPGGRGSNEYKIPKDSFSDQDPYLPMTATMPWPPLVEYRDVGPTAYVKKSTRVLGSAAKLDDPASPFPDPGAAFSVSPCGAIVSIAAGTYPEPVTFSRRCASMPNTGGITLVPTGGAVTIGGS